MIFCSVVMVSSNRRGGALRNPDQLRAPPRLAIRRGGPGHRCQIKFWLTQIPRAAAARKSSTRCGVEWRRDTARRGYQCGKVINIIALATSAHHAIETPNIQASRFMSCPPIHDEESLRVDADTGLTERAKVRCRGLI